MNNIVRDLIDAYISRDNSSELEAFGVSIGKLYTDHGLPLDVAFDNLPLNLDKTDKLIILEGSLNWFIQHKRQSGASEKSLERQRKLNTRAVKSFIETEEIGIY